MAVDIDHQRRPPSASVLAADNPSLQEARHAASHPLPSDSCLNAVLGNRQQHREASQQPSSPDDDAKSSHVDLQQRGSSQTLEAHDHQTAREPASPKGQPGRQHASPSPLSAADGDSAHQPQPDVSLTPPTELAALPELPSMPSAWPGKSVSRHSTPVESSQDSSRSSVASSNNSLARVASNDSSTSIASKRWVDDPNLSQPRIALNRPPPPAPPAEHRFPSRSNRGLVRSSTPDDTTSADLSSPSKRLKLSPPTDVASFPASHTQRAQRRPSVDGPTAKAMSDSDPDPDSDPDHLVIGRRPRRRGSERSQPPLLVAAPVDEKVDADRKAEHQVNVQVEAQNQSPSPSSPTPQSDHQQQNVPPDQNVARASPLEAEVDSSQATSGEGSVIVPSTERTTTQQPAPATRGGNFRGRRKRGRAARAGLGQLRGQPQSIQQSASSLAPNSSRNSPAPSPSRGSRGRGGFGGRGRGGWGWRGRGGSRGGRFAGAGGKDRGDTPEPPHKPLLNLEEKLTLQHIRARQNELKKFFSVLGSHQRDILDQLAGRDLTKLLGKSKTYTKPLEYFEVTAELERRQQEACDIVRNEYHFQLEQADHDRRAQKAVIERQFRQRVDGSLQDHADGAKGDILLLKNAHHAAIDETWTDHGSNVECYFPRYHEMPEPDSRVRGYDSLRIHDEKPFKKHLNSYDDQAQREVIDYDVVLPIAEALAERRAAEKAELDRVRTQNMEELALVAHDELKDIDEASRPSSDQDNPQFALSRLADIAEQFAKQGPVRAPLPPATYPPEPPPHYRPPFAPYDHRPLQGFPPPHPPPPTANMVPPPLYEPPSPYSHGRRPSSRKQNSISTSVPSKRSSINEEMVLQTSPVAPNFGPLAPLAPAPSRMPPPPPSFPPPPPNHHQHHQHQHHHHRQSSGSSIPPPPTPSSAGPYSRPPSSHAFVSLPATGPTPIPMSSQPPILPPLQQPPFGRPLDTLPPAPLHAGTNGTDHLFNKYQPHPTQQSSSSFPPSNATAVSPVQHPIHRDSFSRAMPLPPPPPPPPPPPATTSSAPQNSYPPPSSHDSFSAHPFDRRPSQSESSYTQQQQQPPPPPPPAQSSQPPQPSLSTQPIFSLQQRPQQQQAQPTPAPPPLPMQSHQTRFSIHTPGSNARVPISRDPNSRRPAGNRITFTPAQTPQDNRFKNRTSSPRPPPINTSLSRRNSSRNQSPSPQTAGPLATTIAPGSQQTPQNLTQNLAAHSPPPPQSSTAINEKFTPTSPAVGPHQRQPLQPQQQHLPPRPAPFHSQAGSPPPPPAGTNNPNNTTLPGTNKMHNTFVNQTLESRAQAEVARANAAKTQGLGMGPKGGKRVLLPKV